MPWFKRTQAGIQTDADERINVPEGQWIKDPVTGDILNRRELEENLKVSPDSGHHFTYTSKEYFDLLFDDAQYTLHDENLVASDPLSFTDTKPYRSRLVAAQRKTGLNDAIRSATGLMGGHPVSIAAMDFTFIGGSMGSVVGEVIARAIKRGVEENRAVIVISQSGGARMMEAAHSLMQMAKTSAWLGLLAEKGLPYFSLMTHPTTGGVTASFAMLGDFNLAEPGALIGFAGPRVIRETIGSDLPDGFQRAEFLLEKGFVDRVVDRRTLRKEIVHLLNLLAG